MKTIDQVKIETNELIKMTNRLEAEAKIFLLLVQQYNSERRILQ